MTMRPLLILFALMPGVALAQSPTPEQMLDALYRTVALVEFCEIEVDDHIGESIARLGFDLERGLGISREGSEHAYEIIKTSLLAVPPDCSPDSPDLAGVFAILTTPGE